MLLRAAVAAKKQQNARALVVVSPNGGVACNLIAEIATTLILAYSISARPPSLRGSAKDEQEERENDEGGGI